MFSASTFFKRQITTKKEMEDVLPLAGGEVCRRISYSASDFSSNRKLCCQVSSMLLYCLVVCCRLEKVLAMKICIVFVLPN